MFIANPREWVKTLELLGGGGAHCLSQHSFSFHIMFSSQFRFSLQNSHMYFFIKYNASREVIALIIPRRCCRQPKSIKYTGPFLHPFGRTSQTILNFVFIITP